MKYALFSPSMPSCPICGKEVPPQTAYCPACGARLPGAASTSNGGIRSDNYGLPAGSSTQVPTYTGQPSSTWQQPPTRPSRRKLIIGIIVALIIGLIIGGVVGSLLPVAPDVTFLTGNVSLSSQNQGTPNFIQFNSRETGNLTSTVARDSSYAVYLPIGSTYTVTIHWYNVTGGVYMPHTCSASPGSFSSSDPNATQNFSC